METRTCPTCNTLFLPKEQKQVYCSRPCAARGANKKQAELRKTDAGFLARWQHSYQQAQAKRYRQPADAKELLLHCPVCQTSFKPKAKRQQICSLSCAAKKARAAQLQGNSATVNKQPDSQQEKVARPQNTTIVTMAMGDESPYQDTVPYPITRTTMQAMQAAYGASGVR